MKDGKAAARLRRLLNEPGFFAAPSIYDPLSARIAQQLGFKAVFLGGWAQGSQLCVPEPTLTMTEVIEGSRVITKAVDIPLITDVGGGYGEPVHVTRTVRECEYAGIAGIQLEDQAFPKRAHYHKMIEHVISVEEMIDKIVAAKEARKDPNFVIIGRTDAMLAEGFKEAIRRANLYAEAGCDLMLFFPNTMEEARIAPREINAPVVAVHGSGRTGRPVIAWKELEELGYKMCIEALMLTMALAKTTRDVLSAYMRDGRQTKEMEDDLDLRHYVENLIGLPEYYEIEERTVERDKKVMPGTAGLPKN